MTDDTATSVSPGDVPKGGADHGKMSPAQKTLRDAAIVAALHAGTSVKDVATRYEITPRSVHRVFEEFKLRPTAADNQPMEIMERAVRTYEQQMESFAAVAENSIERFPAVAIAALRGFADTHERYLRLLGDIGKLPDNLGLFRAESELNQVAERLERVWVDVIEGVRSPEAGFEEWVRLMTPQTPLWDAPPGSVRELEPGD